MGGQSSSDSESGGGDVFSAQEKVRGVYIAFWASESTVAGEIGIFVEKEPLHFGLWS